MHMKQQIQKFAKSLGFDLVGFSPAKVEQKYLKVFTDWLAKNYEGDMSYMQKIQQRQDLTQILPGAKSVIVLAKNYYQDQPELKKDHGKVARYAYGRDYHKIIQKNLKQLVAYLEEIAPDHKHKAYVDTGPVLERALAEQAGIGIIGKNSCLITPQFGSWVFLAEVITTLPLAEKKAPSPFKHPAHPCGNCTKCIDACPTGAIIAPGVIDSRLCISYLTIENKDSIPPNLAKIIKKAKTLYGCDICQEVCPHNSARQSITTHSSLSEPKIAGHQLDLKKLARIKTPEQFIETFAGSPIMRAKKEGLQRNAKAILP